MGDCSLVTEHFVVNLGIKPLAYYFLIIFFLHFYIFGHVF